MIEKFQDSRAVLLGAVAIFAFGLTFEMPVILIVLIRAGIISTSGRSSG